MVKENITLIKNLVKNKNPMYGILGFTSDTFEILKTNTHEIELSKEDRTEFNKAMRSIIAGMKELDSLVDRLS